MAKSYRFDPDEFEGDSRDYRKVARRAKKERKAEKRRCDPREFDDRDDDEDKR